MRRVSHVRRIPPAASRARTDPAATDSGRWLGFLAALFLVALAWRLLAFRGVADEVWFDQLIADSAAYWAWADEIRAGRWLGDNPFFLGPLCAYWTAFARFLAGDSVAAVIRVQLVLGAATAVLIADATRRIAAPWAGVVAGLIVAFYPMAIFFDLQVLAENQLLFLGALLLWCLARGSGQDARMTTSLACGLIVGVMAQGRGTALLLAIPCVMSLCPFRARARAAAMALALALGIAVVTIPVGLHQATTGGGFRPFTYSLGLNAYLGNGPGANGTYRMLAEVALVKEPPPRSAHGACVADGRAYLSAEAGHELTHVESSREWLRRTIRHVAAQPMGAIRLLFLKLGLVVSHDELPQIANLHTFATAAGAPLAAVEFAFALLLIGGLAGVPIAWRRRVHGRALIAWVLVTWLGAAVFFVVDRYRVHLLIPLATLSGVAVAAAAARLKEGAGAPRWPLAAGAALGAVLTILPLVPKSQAHERWSQLGMAGDSWLERGDAARAAKVLAEAAAIDRAGALPADTVATARFLRAAVFENLGFALERLGDDPGAADAFSEAIRLMPNAPSPHAYLASTLARLGEHDRARAELAAAGIAPEQHAAALTVDAMRYGARGDSAGTRRSLLAAVAFAPGYEPAVVPILRLALQEGALDYAGRLLASARSAGLDRNVGLAHEAWLEAARGNRARARRLLDEIPAPMRTADERIVATLELMRPVLAP